MGEAMLHDRRVLLVEDEYFIADAMRRELEEVGAHVIGPVASVREALAIIASEAVDGAILDVSLSDGKVFPVADVLGARNIPFLFATGYSESDLPETWRHVARFEKPIDVAIVARTLIGNSGS